MSLLIQKSGILTSVQDLGRYQFQRSGINPGGVMDRAATRLINILLGNDENEAVLEIHFPAPRILFESDALIALGGANFSAHLNRNPIENWHPFFVEKNSILEFDRKISGHRLYLSIKGGFKIPGWLGSKSTNLLAKIGGFQGRALQKNDRLFFNSQPIRPSSGFPYFISKKILPFYSSFPTIRLTEGAEFKKMTAQSRTAFLSNSFTIRPDSNRMGFRLQSGNLSLEKKLELISSAVNFGTVQLLPDGQLIILMADHQTTGGYPRIGHIISADLPLAAQLGPNDKLNFALVTLEEAERLTLEFEKDLKMLKTACGLVNVF